jgi:putative ABC transport system permease protein
MFKNYFKVAVRSLKKNKLYAFVNITGLSIGIAGCILIGMYIHDELSYDKFHSKANNIVRMTMDYNTATLPTQTANTGTKVGPQLQRTFPSVETYCRAFKFPRVLVYEDKMFEEKNFLYADSAFFQMFSFELIKGNAATALNAPDKLVLSANAAEKYFGYADPIGKTIKVGVKDFQVSGIVQNAPENSQIQYDMIGSFTSLGASKEEKWWEANYITYLLLREGTDVKSFETQVKDYMKKVSKDELKMEGSSYLTYNLEPLTSVHLHSKLDGLEPNNNITYIYILAVVAFLIVLVACVNYTNLSTAQSAGRNAEIGMRKVLGAEKTQLFKQFFSESFIVSCIALFLAIILAEIALPFFNQISGKNLSHNAILSPVMIGSLIGITLLTTFMSGLYPALMLTKGRIIDILKSGFNFSGSNTLRKSLIVFQFVISVFLIISTVIILQQLKYIRTKDLGYNKDQVIVLPIDRTMLDKYDDLKAALKNTPNVISVAGAYEPPTHIGWGDGIALPDGKNITVNAIPVDEDFVRTMNMQIVAGSDYNMSDVKQFDTSDGGNNIRYTFMLNESAVKALGWKPNEAIGRTISKGREGVVKAVVKDFHFRSLHEPINPLVIFLDKRILGSVFIRVTGESVNQTIQRLQTIWKDRVKHRPFEYHFLDEDYDSMYKIEQRTAAVFSTFAVLAIFLACLGLFALTAYSIVKRSKEIGIRKVLGATVPDIISLLSKEFLKLVIIGLLIAIPVAWYGANQWLSDFNYRINIEWWVFIAAGVSIILIALVTISIQALRAGIANPVKSLRTE